MSKRTYKPTYEIFSGDDLVTAELIQRRRLQMLVHSYIYYNLDSTIIDDYTWSKWAMELKDLQNKYPEIAKQVMYSDEFVDWDGSTGFNLNFDERIIAKANYLLKINVPKKSKPKTIPQGMLF